MNTLEVEAISPHQYRQKDRAIGEKYLADAVHLPLLKIKGWAKPVEVEAEALMPQNKRRNARSK